ncbi:DUF6069 family protein [Streptomyces sp. CA-111067]|uniref:DUF6069 family protein n=1 Tax=Streptomyces sp. CA-111067 TaxID=3240046 RepID=UPI003D95288A
MSTQTQSNLTAAPATAATTTRARWQPRAAAVVAATLLPAAVWPVAHALGAGFVLKDSTGSVTISLPIVLVFSLLFALLGWGSLAVLERRVRRAPARWTGLAAAVALLSLVPVLLENATGGTKTALMLIHLTVAAALIPLLRRTTGAR